MSFTWFRRRGEARALSASLCPFCSCRLDAVTALTGGAGPRPGSLAICVTCGEILRLTDDLLPRPIEHAELLSICDRYPDVAVYIAAAQHVVRTRRPVAVAA